MFGTIYNRKQHTGN